jgi:DNA invertase Pin-like site-specific DNA recombinase
VESAAVASPDAPRGKTAVRKPRKRAKITDETRAEVKKLAEAGKTGNEIAKALEISLPSVQNI